MHSRENGPGQAAPASTKENAPSFKNTSIDVGVKENNRFLRQLSSETLSLVTNKEVPIPIKCFVVPLFAMLATLSGTALVLIAELIISFQLGRSGVNFANYLIFLAAMTIVYFVAAFMFAHLSMKFQNAQELREQLSTVTRTRRPRQRASTQQ